MISVLYVFANPPTGLLWQNLFWSTHAASSTGASNVVHGPYALVLRPSSSSMHNAHAQFNVQEGEGLGMRLPRAT